VSRSITVRDVPDDAVAELASRAAETGRSLQEYLRARLIDMARVPDVEVWVSRVEARQAVTGGSITADEILAHRDADRRE
jgi:plasmid stability protein